MPLMPLNRRRPIRPCRRRRILGEPRIAGWSILLEMRARPEDLQPRIRLRSFEGALYHHRMAGTHAQDAELQWLRDAPSHFRRHETARSMHVDDHINTCEEPCTTRRQPLRACAWKRFARSRTKYSTGPRARQCSNSWPHRFVDWMRPRITDLAASYRERARTGADARLRSKRDRRPQPVALSGPACALPDASSMSPPPPGATPGASPDPRWLRACDHPITPAMTHS